ncbi:MAG: hypothetical protein LBL61_01720 [Elusimicrobiota bacterium]|jgi:hypothetical protein|nr:hypothetical protein [Elusimicrobiota bacterium]
MNAKKILKFFIICAFAAAPARGAAQMMQYVTYFPVPHAYYSTLNVNRALLATRGLALNDAYTSGEVVIGSEGSTEACDPSTGECKLNVNGTFSPQNFTISASVINLYDEDTKTWKNLTVLGSGNSGILGILGVHGNMTIDDTSEFAPSALIAYNNLTIGAIQWAGITGSLDASSCSDLSWKTLKLLNTDAYHTYLVCTPSP